MSKSPATQVQPTQTRFLHQVDQVKLKNIIHMGWHKHVAHDPSKCNSSWLIQHIPVQTSLMPVPSGALTLAFAIKSSLVKIIHFLHLMVPNPVF